MVMTVSRVQDGTTHVDPSIFPTGNLQGVINKQVGAYLTQVRMHQALTLDQVSRKFSNLGGVCTPEKWRGWEQGNYRPSRDDLIIAARVLKENPSDFIRDINAISQEMHYLQEESMIVVPAQETAAAPQKRKRADLTVVPVEPARMTVEEIAAPVQIPVINMSGINLEEELDPDVIVALRLAAVIKRGRTSLSASSAEIAELLTIPAAVVSQLEKGTARLSAELISTVCTTFGIDPTTYQLQAGFIPTDILTLLRRHPEVIAELRERFG